MSDFTLITDFIAHYNLVAAGVLLLLGWRAGTLLQRISDNHLTHIQGNLEDTLVTAKETQLVMERLSEDTRQTSAEIAVMSADLRRHQQLDEDRYAQISLSLAALLKK